MPRVNSIDKLIVEFLKMKSLMADALGFRGYQFASFVAKLPKDKRDFITDYSNTIRGKLSKQDQINEFKACFVEDNIILSDAETTSRLKNLFNKKTDITKLALYLDGFFDIHTMDFSVDYVLIINVGTHAVKLGSKNWDTGVIEFVDINSEVCEQLWNRCKDIKLRTLPGYASNTMWLTVTLKIIRAYLKDSPYCYFEKSFNDDKFLDKLQEIAKQWEKYLEPETAENHKRQYPDDDSRIAKKPPTSRRRVLQFPDPEDRYPANTNSTTSLSV